MRKCVVTECKNNVTGLCPDTSCTRYDLYQKVTGECVVCGRPMKGHPVCAACGIMVGPSHTELSLKKYQGHQVCDWCVKRWELREKVLGRPVSFDDFYHPELAGKKEARHERIHDFVKKH